jgi:hypothetical protein
MTGGIVGTTAREASVQILRRRVDRHQKFAPEKSNPPHVRRRTIIMRAIAKTAEPIDHDDFALWIIALGIFAGTFLTIAI